MIKFPGLEIEDCSIYCHLLNVRPLPLTWGVDAKYRELSMPLDCRTVGHLFGATPRSSALASQWAVSVSVNSCVVLPRAFVAVMVGGYVATVPNVGTPDGAPVASLNDSPGGFVPLSEYVGHEPAVPALSLSV